MFCLANLVVGMRRGANTGVWGAYIVGLAQGTVLRDACLLVVQNVCKVNGGINNQRMSNKKEQIIAGIKSGSLVECEKVIIASNGMAHGIGSSSTPIILA